MILVLVSGMKGGEVVPDFWYLRFCRGLEWLTYCHGIKGQEASWSSSYPSASQNRHKPSPKHALSLVSQLKCHHHTQVYLYCSPTLPFRSFIVLCFMFRPMIHFEFIFVSLYLGPWSILSPFCSFCEVCV